eukprot:4615490-Alexandrium_andersonii.AAC.1
MGAIAVRGVVVRVRRLRGGLIARVATASPSVAHLLCAGVRKALGVGAVRPHGALGDDVAREAQG